MHGTVAAVLVGVCVAAVLVLIAAGMTRVAKPLNAAPPPVASDAPPIGTYSHHPVVVRLPARPESYVGAFVKGVPDSYAPVRGLANDVHARLNLALYYSGWRESFRSAFAFQAAANGTVPFIQIEPSKVNMAAIVAGVYDTYLETFATSVANYGAKTGKAVPAWMVFDSRFRRKFPIGPVKPGMLQSDRKVTEALRPGNGWLHRADPLEALATSIEVPADTLAATVARFNGFARAGAVAPHRAQKAG